MKNSTKNLKNFFLDWFSFNGKKCIHTKSNPKSLPQKYSKTSTHPSTRDFKPPSFPDREPNFSGVFSVGRDEMAPAKSAPGGKFRAPGNRCFGASAGLGRQVAAPRRPRAAHINGRIFFGQIRLMRWEMGQRIGSALPARQGRRVPW